MNLRGHAWTLLSPLRDYWNPPCPPPSSDWIATSIDPVRGEVRHTGRWSHLPDNKSLVIIVHGLGGNPERPYCLKAASIANRFACSSLRISLRGADHRGNDFHHAGLTEDLHTALLSPQLAGYQSIFLLGYSVGGHICLRYATENMDPRVQGVAAVCPPLDLVAVGRAMDSRSRSFYRHSILNSLKRMYCVLAKNHAVPTPTSIVNRVRTFREWDSLTIVPRFGFEDVAHYYRSMSVGPHLGSITVPTLIVSSVEDPMIPFETVAPYLHPRGSSVEDIQFTGSGHIGFPTKLPLPRSSRMDLESHILRWFLERSD
ncbi:MAG: alpha/beta fold hydrolase [Planctomycetota bacterium]|nr:alpha/beta fold hydrolase [Planctomycetota bacterium]